MAPRRGSNPECGRCRQGTHALCALPCECAARNHARRDTIGADDARAMLGDAGTYGANGSIWYRWDVRAGVYNYADVRHDAHARYVRVRDLMRAPEDARREREVIALRFGVGDVAADVCAKCPLTRGTHAPNDDDHAFRAERMTRAERARTTGIVRDYRGMRGEDVARETVRGRVNAYALAYDVQRSGSAYVNDGVTWSAPATTRDHAGDITETARRTLAHLSHWGPRATCAKCARD